MTPSAPSRSISDGSSVTSPETHSTWKCTSICAAALRAERFSARLLCCCLFCRIFPVWTYQLSKMRATSQRSSSSSSSRCSPSSSSTRFFAVTTAGACILLVAPSCSLHHRSLRPRSVSVCRPPSPFPAHPPAWTAPVAAPVPSLATPELCKAQGLHEPPPLGLSERSTKSSAQARGLDIFLTAKAPQRPFLGENRSTEDVAILWLREPTLLSASPGEWLAPAYVPCLQRASRSRRRYGTSCERVRRERQGSTEMIRSVWCRRDDVRCARHSGSWARPSSWSTRWGHGTATSKTARVSGRGWSQTTRQPFPRQPAIPYRERQRVARSNGASHGATAHLVAHPRRKGGEASNGREVDVRHRTGHGGLLDRMRQETWRIGNRDKETT